MWISEQGRRRNDARAEARVGETTVSDGVLAVRTEGEERELTLYAPGGYRWRPAVGEQVLVIKAGPYGEERCVAGARCESGGLAPGEIELTGSGCAIRLGRDGVIRMTGTVLVNGQPVTTGGSGDGAGT